MMGSMMPRIRCGGKAVTAIVLAGGRSRRMKADKARLSIRGETLLGRVVGQLRPHFDEVLVSVSPRRRVHLPQAGGLKLVEDAGPGLGPLAGILAGLKAAANDTCFVVACDIPDIDIRFAARLIGSAGALSRAASAAGPVEIVVPRTPAGHAEPLFAVYTKPVAGRIEELLTAGVRSVLPLFEACRTEFVAMKDPGWLRNLNTPRDLRDYLEASTNWKKPGRGL
jgi:molybdopterin-guanine dinucleotide biosynthesis protein A